MINIEVRITTEGFTTFSDIERAINICDSIKGKPDINSVKISLISDNISTNNYNSLNSCLKDQATGCNLTVEDITDDLNEEYVDSDSDND